MAPPGGSRLVSARSIFEQNIQKNKEAGFDRNILGHSNTASRRIVKPSLSTKTTNSTSSRTVTRRLFASQKLSDSSHDLNESISSSSYKQQHDISEAIASKAPNYQRRLSASVSSPGRFRSSSSSSSVNTTDKAAAAPLNQPKGQTTEEGPCSGPSELEKDRKGTEIPLTQESKPNAPPATNHKLLMKDLTLNHRKVVVARNKKRQPSRGSISSLADQLSNLELQTSLRRRDASSTGSNASNHSKQSQSSSLSLSSHRNNFVLPDFRQGPRKNVTSSRTQATANRLMNDNSVGSNMKDTSTNTAATEMDDSLDVNDLSGRSKNSLSGSRNGSAMGRFLNDSSNNINSNSNTSPFGPDNRKVHRSVTMDSSSNRRLKNDANSATTSRRSHRGSEIPRSNSSTSWIRRRSSVAVEEDDNNSSVPLLTVPFPTKTVIKRHPPRRQPSTDSTTSRHSTLSSSRSSIAQDENGNNSPLPSLTAPTATKIVIRRRPFRQASNNSSTSQNSIRSTASSNSTTSPRRRPNDKTLTSSCTDKGATSSRLSSSSSEAFRPARRLSLSMRSSHHSRLPPDDHELALLDQLKELEQQIEACESKLGRVQEGEAHELQRIEERKQRKMKRLVASKKKDSKPDAASQALQKQDDKAAFLRQHQQQLAEIEKLKQENARMKEQLKTWEVEAAIMERSQALLETDTLEVNRFVQELQDYQQLQLQEQNTWSKMASLYEKQISNLKTSLGHHDTKLNRTKAERFIYEDRIDMLVDKMQKECKDFSLVEELTMLAFEEDDDGWEDDEEESDDEDDVDYTGRSSYQSKPGNVPQKVSKPPSAVDLIPLSSHSLHLFVE